MSDPERWAKNPKMQNSTKSRDFAHGEAKSKIHWGADIEDVIELLRTD